MFNSTIREVGRAEAKNIITKKSPIGKYWLFDVATCAFVAIDNTTGDAWTEEFDTKEDCLKWLEESKE